MSAEAAVVRACVRELDRRGHLHFNLSGQNGVTGLPDRIALGPGWMLPMEFKGPRGVLSQRQRYVHERFAKAGWPVLVVRDVRELRAALDEIERKDAA